MDVVFLHIALKKLDPDTVRAFEMEHRSSEMPSFHSFASFVRDQIKVMQRSPNVKQEIKRCVDRRQTQPSKIAGSLTYVTATSASLQHACIVCKDKHGNLYNCATFRKYSPSERYKLVKTNNLCLNCLSDKHLVAKCNSRSVCSTCARKYHTLLHFENSNIAASSKADKEFTPTKVNDSSGRPGDVALCSLANMGAQPPSTVLLGTARILVRDSRGNEQSVRTLLDSGAQNSFITRQCYQRLGLVINRSLSCPVEKGIGGTSKASQGYINLKFYSRIDRNVNFDINALVVDRVTERLPTVSVDTSAMIEFKNLTLADDTYAVPGNIDMLIGASLFPHLLLNNKVRGNSSHTAPYALETVLGYVIVGSAPIMDSISATSYCGMAVEPLESLVRKFWEMEEVNVPPIASSDDRLCEEINVRTTVRDRDGRYSVALPFKGDVLSLGDSRQMAEKRFYSLELKRSL
ncbi:unnamed protein product [Parnassius apollo]|uniref:(apollo) hypothetical protein n=1 Tax=Parnassius apollo TaxID=110799 RepID=A0A8S3WEJ8_PARAO|nr:unnamed protein product [Parnassius apollo]